jgi:hypothetical protein
MAYRNYKFSWKYIQTKEYLLTKIFSERFQTGVPQTVSPEK